MTDAPALGHRLVSSLARYEIKLEPDRLGQHLLIDPHAIGVLVRSADLRGKRVLEIGAGPGNVTEQLAREAREVIAIEVDERFKPLLNEVVRRNPNVDVVFGDFRRVAFQSVDAIVGNPPFGLAEAVLRLVRLARPESAALVLGTAICEAAAAPLDSADFSRLGLAVQASFDCRIEAILDHAAFHPRARSRAGILTLRRRPVPSVRWRLLADAFVDRGGMRVQSLLQHIATSRSRSLGPIRYRQALVREIRAALRFADRRPQRLQDMSGDEFRALIRLLAPWLGEPAVR